MKRNYWPLFFIGIFSFVFSMIVWTIHSALKVPVHKDESFLSTYHDVDRDYNKIVSSNIDFEKKYDFKIYINNKEFGLDFKDMFLAQRVIEEKSNHKDIFRTTQNVIKAVVLDKESGEVIKNLDIQLQITVPTNDSHIVNLTSTEFTFNNGEYLAKFPLPYKGNWNITGKFSIDQNIGYFYIKSNAI
ncbi:hypothetical protein CRV08_05160 [Halarcobacter ebronensis]|uniref:YtkA-like domain-containing protein n=1 Tax=Halarcobacter ebronensis TaxID=1462615 RepID=A0A4Q0YEA3_9BACT|nr:hypothetical protein [Halarcobacter ebronensis]RXJ68827.1 hypothetical protein CRV08_05160 [Halarcobacter ebronensis]